MEPATIYNPTAAERRFAQEYCVDWSVVKAAKRAGLSITRAHECMTIPAIAALIREATITYQGQLNISGVQQMARMEALASADIAVVLEAVEGADDKYKDADGKYYPLSERLMMLPDKDRYAIKKISFNKFGPTIEMYDKHAAVMALGKALGVFVDKLEIVNTPATGGDGELSGMTTQEKAEKFGAMVNG